MAGKSIGRRLGFARRGAPASTTFLPSSKSRLIAL